MRSPPPRILIHLDHNPHPRVFDQIMSIDGGVDHVLAHGDVDPQDVPLLISGALYSRPRDELSRTAILITGTNDRVIGEMVRQAKRSFFGDYRVSIMSECKGANAVAGATVARISQLLQVDGLPALVVAGGPVGARVAGLLARAGSEVLLTVFDEDEGADRSEFIGQTFDASVEIVVWKSGSRLQGLLDGRRLLVAAGPPELMLVPIDAWSEASALGLVVDVSGAVPAGIEGLSGEEDGEKSGDDSSAIALGGLAISRHKIRVHREATRRLFDSDPILLGPLEIASLAEELLGSSVLKTPI